MLKGIRGKSSRTSAPSEGLATTSNEKMPWWGFGALYMDFTYVHQFPWVCDGSNENSESDGWRTSDAGISRVEVSDDSEI